MTEKFYIVQKGMVTEFRGEEMFNHKDYKPGSVINKRQSLYGLQATGTFLVQPETVLLTMHRNEYVKFHKTAIDSVLSFLHAVPIFKHQPEEVINQLAQSVEVLNLGTHQVLVN